VELISAASIVVDAEMTRMEEIGVTGEVFVEEKEEEGKKI